MEDNPGQELTLEGFTDDAGGAQGNLALSYRRAAAVKRTLVRRNVARARIHVRAYGESYPAASNRSEAGRRLNRRVEILLADPRMQVSLRTR